MKPYFLIFTLFICLIRTNAQNEKPLEEKWNIKENNDTYFKDINHELDKFLGTWEYVEGNKRFEISFTKIDAVECFGINCTADELSATYKYFENGVELYHSTPQNCEDCFIPTGFSNKIIPNPSNPIDYQVIPPSVTRYHFYIAEPSYQNVSSDAYIEFSKDIYNGDQLIWTNKIEIGILTANGQLAGTYLMPTQMVLTKI